MGLLNNWDVHLGGTISQVSATQCDRCTRGGPTLRRSAGIYPWGGVNTDSRKKISGGMWFNAGRGEEGKSTSFGLSPYVNFRLSTQLTASLSVDASHGNDDAQWFGNFEDAGSTHYTFAHLDQKTIGSSIRVNYTATPNLTFEFYGQPFVSTGTYSDVRELSATPNADKYDDRFKPYVPPSGSAMAFTYSQLRTNAVVRWEYRPGSTLFVVWQHGRQDYQNQNLNRPWSDEYHDLFALHPDNTFLVKFAYWLNR
jgi:hypothetical protein